MEIAKVKFFAFGLCLMKVVTRNIVCSPSPKDTSHCIMADKDKTERQKTSLSSDLSLPCTPIFQTRDHHEKLKIFSDQRLFALGLLQKIAFARSAEAYDQLYEELQESDMPSVLAYFNTNRHGLKEEWVEAFKSMHKNFLNRTNNRVESTNQKNQKCSKQERIGSFFFKTWWSKSIVWELKEITVLSKCSKKVEVLGDPSTVEFQIRHESVCVQMCVTRISLQLNWSTILCRLWRFSNGKQISNKISNWWKIFQTHI